MPSVDPLEVAQRFASALDRSDFAEAARYLSPDCHYQTATVELVGPAAIIGSYRESAEWGSRNLDRVIYESAVQQTAGGLAVLYTDHIFLQGQQHDYQCRQHLTIHDNGLITRIVHEELPGERERLEHFFSLRGVRR